MIEWIKKQGIGAWLALAGIMLGLTAVIVFIVTSTSGFLAGSTVNALPIVFTFLAIVIIAAAIVLSEKLDSKIIDLLIVVAAILLIFSFAIFILERVPQIADVLFIPVNTPASEDATVIASIVGIVFYLLSIISLITCAFFNKLTKEAK